MLELDPDFLKESEHEHDEHVSSFVFKSDKPFDGVKLEEFLSGLVQVYGADMLRYKGVLQLKGNAHRVVFQGVHMLMGGDLGKALPRSPPINICTPWNTTRCALPFS